MEQEKASPAMTSVGMREKRIANILLRFLSEVKEPMETINFLSRIVEEEPETDPSSFYRCDICNGLTKGGDGKLLSFGAFVCRWCSAREMMVGMEEET